MVTPLRHNTAMTRFAHSLPRLARCLVLLAALLPASFSATARAEPPVRPAVECSPRDGLPAFFAKPKAGSDIRVAYLGGSITAAPG